MLFPDENKSDFITRGKYHRINNTGGCNSVVSRLVATP
jgi:hypothetical protein